MGQTNLPLIEKYLPPDGAVFHTDSANLLANVSADLCRIASFLQHHAPSNKLERFHDWSEHDALHFLGMTFAIWREHSERQEATQYQSFASSTHLDVLWRHQNYWAGQPMHVNGEILVAADRRPTPVTGTVEVFDDSQVVASASCQVEGHDNQAVRQFSALIPKAPKKLGPYRMRLTFKDKHGLIIDMLEWQARIHN